LAAAVAETLPFPDPAAPDETVSHGVDVVAVQAQPGGAVTVTAGTPPAAAAIETLNGLTTYEQPAACVTVTVCPLTETVPVRVLAVLAATLKLTVPSPLPLAPALIVSQEAWLVVVQAHPVPAVTVTL
jgi:hypothetical protein